MRSSVITSWGALEAAARTEIMAAEINRVDAAEDRAHGSVREEARVGQRTTLDVLNARSRSLLKRAGQSDHRGSATGSSRAYALVQGQSGRLSAGPTRLPVGGIRFRRAL